jgi:dTDP-4-amino-4,6-dideoxygalactose transaminase
MKLSYPYFDKHTLKKIEQVLKSGRVNYWTGKECTTFEKE